MVADCVFVCKLFLLTVLVAIFVDGPLDLFFTLNSDGPLPAAIDARLPRAELVWDGGDFLPIFTLACWTFDFLMFVGCLDETNGLAVFATGLF